MHSITSITSLSSGFTPEYTNVRTLDLEGPVFQGGAFGDVYDLVAVNGAPPPTPQIVKVLRDNGSGSALRGFETIKKLQGKILDDNRSRRAAQDPALQTLPALRALPQFSFQGQMGGQPVFGYSAARLDTAGYVPFDKILDPSEDPEPRDRYLSELTLEDRLVLAHELAEGVHALRELSYLHGDINPPNLFVNIGECHVALIDFDSGAVTDSPNDAPSTFGKKTEGEWVAPEILDQILKHRSGSGPLEVHVDRFTDDWALTVGIHYLLLLCGPFFVLQRSSSATIRDYVTRFRWPNYDGSDPLFTPELEDGHAGYLEILQELPDAVRKRMENALNGGALNRVRRVLPYQWVVDLGGARETLEILLFQAEPEIVLEGQPVRLTWRVEGSRWVSIDGGIGEVDEAGSCVAVPAESAFYVLTAMARGGATLAETAYVQVLPFPQIRSLNIPEPRLEYTAVLRGLHVAAPSIRLDAPTIRVASPDVHLPLKVSLPVSFAGNRVPGIAVAASAPTALSARSAAGLAPGWIPVPRVADVFDRLSHQMKAELNTWLGGKP